MTTSPRLQYTSVRTRVVDGQVVIGLKHTGKDGEGAQVKLPWNEMPPEDLARLIKTLQQVLDGGRIRSRCICGGSESVVELDEATLAGISSSI